LYRREIGHGNAGGAGPDTAAGWSCGPREIELAACGAWFARDPRPESDELFPMLPTFTDPREVRPLLDWALANPDARQEAALKARAAIDNRTFQAHAAWLLEQLGD
jgi:spore maturation protein CgeB